MSVLAVFVSSGRWDIYVVTANKMTNGENGDRQEVTDGQPIMRHSEFT